MAASDPIRPVSSLLSGRSAKSRLRELELYKAAVGDLTQSARSCRRGLAPVNRHPSSPCGMLRRSQHASPAALVLRFKEAV